jgi:peptide/nickel transport system substrate-binding protein
VLEQARRTTDRTARAALYRQFQLMFADELPAILIYYPIYTYAVDERVQGVYMGPLNYPADRFATVADWYIAIRRVIKSDAPTP